MISVSFIIPTLNAGRVLGKCLASIKKQRTKYHYEIIIIDGGSDDKTLKIAKKNQAKIISNHLKTAEAGKAAGVKIARGKYLAFIDSDNILPSPNWLNQMLQPFSEKEIIGSEPIKFTYRKNAGLIERYSALIGANDPYALITGVYDRFSYLTQKWTGLNLSTTDKRKYLKIKLEKNKLLPTIGANGTIFRRQLFQNFRSDYLFDIDFLTSQLKHRHYLYFAKVKTGIIHTYCENSIKKFIRKQNRRVVDYFTYRRQRHFNWDQTNKWGTIKFVFYTLTLLPMIYHLILGYSRQPDRAWFFHPLACLITLYCYTINYLRYQLGLIKPLNRNQWRQ